MPLRGRLEAALLTLALLGLLQIAVTVWVHYGKNPRYRAAQTEICVDRCLREWELDRLKNKGK